MTRELDSSDFPARTELSWYRGVRSLACVRARAHEHGVRCGHRSKPARRRPWTTWSAKDIYETWGLFHDYGVTWCSGSRGTAT